MWFYVIGFPFTTDKFTVWVCVFVNSSTVSFLPAPMMEQLQFAQTSAPCVSQQHLAQQYAGTLAAVIKPQTGQSTKTNTIVQYLAANTSRSIIFTFIGSYKCCPDAGGMGHSPR